MKKSERGKRQKALNPKDLTKRSQDIFRDALDKAGGDEAKAREIIKFSHHGDADFLADVIGDELLRKHTEEFLIGVMEDRPDLSGKALAEEAIRRLKARSKAKDALQRKN